VVPIQSGIFRMSILRFDLASQEPDLVHDVFNIWTSYSLHGHLGPQEQSSLTVDTHHCQSGSSSVYLSTLKW
jgi:hypothetical protein